MAMDNKRFTTRQSFSESLAMLIGLLQSANNLVPGIVVVALLLIGVVILVAIKSVTIMVAIVLLVVLVSAIVVFAYAKNYGEAALALVAGLLTAFTVDWNPGRFTAFLIIWTAFTLFALIITSLKLASGQESIYLDAAIALIDDSSQYKTLAKQLEAIGKQDPQSNPLQPLQRAQAIRILAYRKIPLVAMSEALKLIGQISVLTRVDIQAAALFVVDIITIFNTDSPDHYENALHEAWMMMRSSAVMPSEFIRAVQFSRSLALTKRVSPNRYFQMVKDCLEYGIAPEEVLRHITDQLN